MIRIGKVFLVLMVAAGWMPEVSLWAQAAPGAAKIAFNSKRDGNYEVYLMNPDGSGAVNMTRHPGTDWVYFAGRRIVMASNRKGGYDRGTYDLYVVHPDSGELRQLTQFPVYDSSLGASPDGRRFVVCSKKDGDTEIYVIDDQGKELAKLTDNTFQDCDPDWSPDGSKIAFRSNRGGAFDIWVMNADGSNPVRLTDFPGNDGIHGYQGEGAPRWSPDGRHIAFMSHRDGDWDIYVMNADGSNLRDITQTASDEGYPAWSPDGRQIAFDSDRDGNQEVYVMNADGTNVSRLTNDPGVDMAPAWVHPEKTATLADFAWLAGNWRGKLQGPRGLVTEQYWAEPQSGVMMGMFRLSDPANAGRTVLLEFISFRETPEGVEMRMRHFDTALTPMEKEEPLRLLLASTDGIRFVFENPVNNVPKRSIVTRVGENGYTGRSEIIRDTGEVTLIETAWERVGAPKQTSAPRGIYKDVVVSASLEDVWKTFTTNAGLATWAAPAANVEMRIGAPFELYFRPNEPAGKRGMEGTKVLSFVPMQMLSYTGMPHCAAAIASGTPPWVVWRFEDLGGNRVRIRFSGHGIGEGEECEKVWAQTDKSMDYIMQVLAKRFAEGPVDWAARRPAAPSPMKP